MPCTTRKRKTMIRWQVRKIRSASRKYARDFERGINAYLKQTEWIPTMFSADPRQPKED